MWERNKDWSFAHFVLNTLPEIFFGLNALIELVWPEQKLATFGDKRFATTMDGISVLSPRYLLGEN